MKNKEALKSVLVKAMAQQEFGIMARFDVKECCAVKEAIEKQIPQEPEYNEIDECYECCDCGCNLGVDEMPSYCPDCGRAILWIDEAEKALEEREAKADYEISKRRDEGQ